MKNTIGIMTLLIMSQPVFADDMVTKGASTTGAMPEAKMSKEQSGFSRGSVVRSAFTRKVDNREPMEDLQNLSNENTKVKFYTELRDMSGQTATHRWEYGGKVVAEVKFDVKGPRWRVWSSKSFVPKWTGDWKVSVVNGAGDVISEKSLSYQVAKLSMHKLDKSKAISVDTMK